MTGPAVRIRPAESDDAEAVRRVCVESWRRAYDELLSDEYVEANLETFYTTERLRREIRSPGEADRWLVAERTEATSGTGRVIGVGRGTKPTNGRCEVFTLYVHPNAQGCGVGTELLETITARQRADGGRNQRVEVFEAHDSAIEFYERHGFAYVDDRRTDIVAGVDPAHRTVRLAREV